MLMEIREKRFHRRKLSINEMQGKMMLHKIALNSATGVHHSNNEINIELNLTQTIKLLKQNRRRAQSAEP